MTSNNSSSSQTEKKMTPPTLQSRNFQFASTNLISPNQSSIPLSMPTMGNIPREHHQAVNDQISEFTFSQPQQSRNNINMNINMNVSNYYIGDSKLEEKFKKEKAKKKYNCNCKRSKCLKLYCDCFANGEFCVDCNCQGCSNVIGNEIEIRKAFNEVKDKNPIAMKFNISEETTTLGCNCTKSNCLKKYCECFKAGLSCTDLCRCRDCDNLPKGTERKLFSNSSIKNNSKALRNVYENFCFQKISVLIEKNTIHIDTYEKITNFDSFENGHKQNEQVSIRIKNHQTFIEIPKAILCDDVFGEKKRKRSVSEEEDFTNINGKKE